MTLVVVHILCFCIESQRLSSDAALVGHRYLAA